MKKNFIMMVSSWYKTSRNPKNACNQKLKPRLHAFSILGIFVFLLNFNLCPSLKPLTALCLNVWLNYLFANIAPTTFDHYKG